MPRLRALLWDVDGTLAETERDGHRVAFNQAFEACGLPWCWDEARYGELLAVTGGRERLLHDMQGRRDAPFTSAERMALARELHDIKNRRYAERVGEVGIPLRPGVTALLAQAAQRGTANAIVTTTSRANVDALLRPHLGPRWEEGFSAVVCGEDVERKKPHPAAYGLALARLRVGADEVMAIEDSPAGAAAALAAGCPVIVTRSVYFDRSPIPGAAAVGPGLHTVAGWEPALPTEDSATDARPVGFDDLVHWWAEAAHPGHHCPVR